MRPLLAATVLSVALAAPAFAMPRFVPDVDAGTRTVQNRFLPRLFGNGDESRAESGADAELRIQQLEQQVRLLTGQVEELTFAVRRMEQGLASPSGGERGGLRPAPGTAGPGEPPRSLGQLPANPGSASTGETFSGPVDLSALNGEFSDTAPEPGEPLSTRPSGPSPASSPALDNVRQLHRSGRYSMAAQAATTVLADNPAGPVAGEARYLLGEALLAQRDFRSAANQFLENYTNDPNGARAPASLLRLSTALNGLGEREAACSSLEELFGAYPNVDASLRAEAEAERRSANCA